MSTSKGLGSIWAPSYLLCTFLSPYHTQFHVSVAPVTARVSCSADDHGGSCVLPCHEWRLLHRRRSAQGWRPVHPIPPCSFQWHFEKHTYINGDNSRWKRPAALHGVMGVPWDHSGYINSRLLTRPRPCFAPIASAKVWAGMEVGGDEGLYPREISMTWGDDCDVEVGTHMKSPMIQNHHSSG